MSKVFLKGVTFELISIGRGGEREDFPGQRGTAYIKGPGTDDNLLCLPVGHCCWGKQRGQWDKAGLGTQAETKCALTKSGSQESESSLHVF